MFPKQRFLNLWLWPFFCPQMKLLIYEVLKELDCCGKPGIDFQKPLTVWYYVGINQGKGTYIKLEEGSDGIRVAQNYSLSECQVWLYAQEISDFLFPSHQHSEEVPCSPVQLQVLWSKMPPKPAAHTAKRPLLQY